jgi:RNA-binding protein
MVEDVAKAARSEGARPMNGKQRSTLRALAHHLQPVVQVGKLGVTPAITSQVEDQLRAHELIKVRFAREAPEPASQAAASLATTTRAELIQTSGRIVTLYKRHDKKPKISLPAPGAKAAAGDEAASRRDPRLSLRRKHAAGRAKQADRAEGELPRHRSEALDTLARPPRAKPARDAGAATRTVPKRGQTKRKRPKRVRAGVHGR